MHPWLTVGLVAEGEGWSAPLPRGARSADADPAAALSGWQRQAQPIASGLAPSRLVAIAISIVLHAAVLALLIHAAMPVVPEAVGSHEVERLEVEFLPSPAPQSVAKPIPTPSPVAAVPAVKQPAPAAIVIDPRPPAMPEPVAESVPSESLAVATAPAVELPMPSEPAAPVETPAAASPTPEAPLDARGKRAQSQYLRDLMRWLAQHRAYPAEARKLHLEGVVRVRFSIDRDGRLLSSTVAESAGAELLDRAALDVLQRADPMPPFPKHLARQRLSVTLPIDFSLTRD